MNQRSVGRGAGGEGSFMLIGWALKGSYWCALGVSFNGVQEVKLYLILWRCNYIYWVSQKKLLHKSEEKMHKKMKMTLQGAENLVHKQQHHGKHFFKKSFSNTVKYGFFNENSPVKE